WIKQLPAPSSQLSAERTYEARAKLALEAGSWKLTRMPECLVPHFQEELQQLKTRLLEMGGLAEDRVRSVVQALVDQNAPIVDRVLSGDGPINQLHIEIDSRRLE